jgi:hypothetical protein
MQLVSVTRQTWDSKANIRDGLDQASERRILTISKTFFAVGFCSGRSLLVVFFRLRFGNCDASRTLTLVSYNILDARDRGNRIGNSRGNGKDRGLWSVPFPFARPLAFQQGETPSTVRRVITELMRLRRRTRKGRRIHAGDASH